MELGWTDLTPAELEREYSPSSCLADAGEFRQLLTSYRDRSDVAWRNVTSRPDATTTQLDYGSGDWRTIDVVVPKASSPPPMLTFIHGGYWQQLSHLDARFAASACIDRGWAFSAVDYPLAPNASLDEIVAACCEATVKLHGEAERLGFDASRIVVAGSSAGAHLSAMVALASGVELTGAVLLSGVFELEPLLTTTVNDAVDMDLAEALRNSPMRHGVDQFPPTVMAYGSNETNQFKLQTHAFAERLRAADIGVEVHEISGCNHFDVIFDLAEPKTVLGDAVAAQIDATKLGMAQLGMDNDADD